MTQPDAASISEGDRVEANYRGRGRYYPGRVRFDHGNGTYDIAYDDGEQETHVSGYQIRMMVSAGATASATSSGGATVSSGEVRSVRPTAATPIREGDRVEANYRGRGRYYPGRVRRDRGDGTYDIDYDDGESELRVREVDIRVTESSGQVRRATFREGDRVETNNHWGGGYYSGRVRLDRGDGTYDIDNDNGEQETHVTWLRIRVAAPSVDDRGVGPAAATPIREGDRVEANYRGRGRFYPGRVRRARGDGTYDINYEDGELELRVREVDIRTSESSGVTASDGATVSSVEDRSVRRAVATSIREGDRVETNYRGSGRYFPGRVRRDRGDGTYDIDNDDGEQETHVPWHQIRVAASGGEVASSGDDRGVRPIREGDRVEANYRGRGRYYPGRVRRARGDGTYDIDYEDGELELRVREVDIRVTESSGVTASDGAAALTVDDRGVRPTAATPIREGDRVEANYRGRGRYYPGRVRRARGDGTYDIDYDDGESELRVREVEIREPGGVTASDGVTVSSGSAVLSGAATSSGATASSGVAASSGEDRSIILVWRAVATSIREGDRVEANYRGRGSYFPGRVRLDHGDGTFDIDYDDGEKESRVREDEIRLTASSVDDRSPGQATIREGDRVEVNYRGRGKYYPGRVRRNRGDGTFDIDYEDGDAELRVRLDHIRSTTVF